MSLIVGLTGGVASGKSHVLHLFQALGVPAIEADDVGRAVVAAGEPALAEIAAQFGSDVLLADATLNRARMREVAFGNPQALAQLNAITHPHIRQRLRAWCAAQTAPYCILSAAILIESGLSALADRILVVDAPEAHQLSRLMRRDRIAEPLAQAMLARQATRAERLAAAHAVIENPDPPADLTPVVAALHQRWMNA